MKSWNVRTLLAPILIVLGVGTFLLYPFETTVIPEWRVRVVDERESPLPGTVVIEYWSHTSYESGDHQAESVTDSEGFVTFPSRTIRASLIKRGGVPLLNRLNVHGVDRGPHGYLVVRSDMNSTTDNSDYLPGRPLPRQIVLRRLK
jgi:hypothetical protein